MANAKLSELPELTAPTANDLLLASDEDSGDYTSKKITFPNAKTYFSPSATESVAGIAELATTAEAQALADTGRIVTPAGLAAVTATEARTGIAELATTAEAKALADDARIVTPAKLLDVFEDHAWGAQNILINTNGKAAINQRGATTVANGAYGFDRWKSGHNCTTVTASQETTGLRHTATTVGAATYFNVQQIIDNFASYSGKTLTLSACVKSNKAGTTLGFFRDGFYTSGGTTHTGGGAFETLTYTLAVGTLASGLGVYLDTGSAPADGDYMEFAWIKLEEGSVATPWTMPDPQQELARSMRYFQVLGKDASDAYAPIGTGQAYSTTQFFMIFSLGVTMRASPVATISAASDWGVTVGAGTLTPCSTLAHERSTPLSVKMNGTVASGLAAGDALLMLGYNSANARIYFDAEL